MTLKIKPNISTRAYNIEKKDSRSYIIDEENGCGYILDGLTSDIWHKIFTIQNIQAVKKYAIEKGVEDEIDEFIKELVLLNFITLDDNNCILERKITENIKNSSNSDNELFIHNQEKWLYSRGFLRSLTLYLSYRCNLNCRHCFNDKSNSGMEISAGDAKRIIDEAYELGVAIISVSGGECTIHKDFFDIISYIRKKRISLSFITNCQELNDNNELFENVVSLYPHDIKTSIYSMNPDIHDGLTGIKGSLEKTKNAVKKLRERNIEVIINYLELSANSGSYKDVAEFGNDLGAEVDYSSFFIINPQNNNADLFLSEDRIIKNYLDKNLPDSVYSNKKFRKKWIRSNNNICGASKYTLSVLPSLTVAPCYDSVYVLGDLNKTTLKHIWENEAVEFRKIFKWKNLKECGGESYCKYCCYCACRANYENGFLKKSFVSCTHARATEKAVLLSQKEKL